MDHFNTSTYDAMLALYCRKTKTKQKNIKNNFLEEFEDTKALIRIHKSKKDRQHRQHNTDNTTQTTQRQRQQDKQRSIKHYTEN